MRRTATLLAVVFFAASAFAQEDKKTDDLKPADPDTGESTVEETTLGLLPQPVVSSKHVHRRQPALRLAAGFADLDFLAAFAGFSAGVRWPPLMLSRNASIRL